jgi:L-seryl-tRNA(Ser) seleniumtransferase
LGKDQFGNEVSNETGFAWGRVITDIVIDSQRHAKMRRTIADRIARLESDGFFDFTGVHRHFVVKEPDKPFLDEWLGESYFNRIRQRVFEIMGGFPDEDDVLILNRTTAGILAALFTLAKEGETVVSVAPTDGKKYGVAYTHPCVLKGIALARARFKEVYGPKELEEVLEKEKDVSIVVINAVGKVALDVFPEKELKKVIGICKARKKITVADDAWGRIRSVVSNQPRIRELGVDVGVQALDKLALPGPRFGLLVGRKDLVQKIGATAYRYAWEARPTFFPGVLRALEQYDPEEILGVRDVSKRIVDIASRLYGYGKIVQISAGARISGDDLFRILLQKAKLNQATTVPYEAAQALGMALLENYGVLTIPVMAAPVGSPGMKILPSSTEMKRFGDEQKFVAALDDSFDRVAVLLNRTNELHKLLLG